MNDIGSVETIGIQKILSGMRYSVVACLVFALLNGCNSCNRASVGPQPDRELAAQVPSDVSVVFGVDITKLKPARVYQRHAAGAQIPLLDAASQRLGVDPRRDLASALVYLTPLHQPVALLHGTFSNDALRTKLLSFGAKPSPSNSSLLQTREEAVLFTGPGILAVGPARALAVSSILRGLPEGVSSRLQGLSKSDQIWFISDQGLNGLNLQPNSNLGSALGLIAGYITGASAGLHLDDGVHLQADLSCVSTRGAEQVRDALRGFIALGRLTTSRNETDLLQIYDAIHVDEDRDLVHIRADLSPELSDRALTYLARFQLKPKLER